MYKGVANIFAKYWQAYGGLRALLCSPYLHIAVLVLLPLTYHTWSKCDWWNDPMAALPNLLGFTLAGLAMSIGFGDDKFRALLAEPGVDLSKPSDYVVMSSTFVHFIVIQLFALVYSVAAKGLWFYAEWVDPIRDVLPVLNQIAGGIGYGLFLYALMSVLAATMAVFRIASMYEAYQRHLANQPKTDSK